MSFTNRNWTAVLCAGFVLIQLAGCGAAPTTLERSATLVGKVSYQNKPVEEGTVELSDPKVGGGGAGTLGPGGTFEIKGLLAGKYKVSIQPPMVEDRGDGKTAPRKVPKTVTNIPEKYRSDATSGFVVDLIDGEQSDAEFKME